MKTKQLITGLLIIFSLITVQTVSAGIFGDDVSPAEERKTIQAERKEILKKDV